MADYKEGVDFEWVLAKNQPKGGTNKTRRFFSAAVQLKIILVIGRDW